MKRAIRLATGHDPAKNFARCPAHVVVLAGRVGPAPYELEDVYPVNASAPSPGEYGDDPRPLGILATRMADYIVTHTHYRHIAAFASDPYARVLDQARHIASERLGRRLQLDILPREGGRLVKHVGKSTPRTYWQKAWIQLYDTIVPWLEADARPEGAFQRAAAEERLTKARVIIQEE